MKKIITVALLGATLLSTAAHASVYDRSWIKTNKQICQNGGLYPRFYFDKYGKIENVREDYYDTRWGGPGTCEKALDKQLNHLLNQAHSKQSKKSVKLNYEKIISYLNSHKNTKHNLSIDMIPKRSYGMDYKIRNLDRNLEGL